MREIWVWSLGREDPLEKDMATHSSTPAWRIPTDRGAWRAAAHGVAESDTTERLNMLRQAQRPGLHELSSRQLRSVSVTSSARRQPGASAAVGRVS